MDKLFFLLFLSPCMLLADSGSQMDIDIVERIINFVIFLALIYYFGVDKIKFALKQRPEEIANSLLKIQEKLQEIKKEKQKIFKNLEEAKKKADEIIETAHREADIITRKIEENSKLEIENLVRYFNESIAFERRKIEKVVIREVVNELINENSIVFNKEGLAQALLNKAV